jgi:hypothetical protein
MRKNLKVQEKFKEKESKYDSFLKSDPNDSNITQKTAEKKLASLVSSFPKPKNSKLLFNNPYSPRRNSKYYVSEAVRGVNEKNSLILEHINSSIRMIKAC